VIRLTLTSFRNAEALRLEVDPRPVVITGPNGIGKTNLLEAISYLSPGRGLRGAALDRVGRRSPAAAPAGTPWAVAATVELPDGRVELGTGFEG
jgi:DNA replication and repair protein RecF